MNSPQIKSIAADSNVLLSAIAGRAARRVFERNDLLVVTTDFNIAEVEEYLPVFANRYNLPESLLSEVLSLLPIEIHSESTYGTHLEEARVLLSQRDPDDVALAALALKLAIPIWSNDRDYEAFPHGMFTTAVLIDVLGV